MKAAKETPATPRSQNLRMPAEWAPHAATWIAWPHNPEDWPGKFQPIPWVYCEIVRHLSGAEDVHILVNDLAAERRATRMLRKHGANLARLHFHHWRTDRVWLRDSGPIFLKGPDDRIALTDWKFNAWAKYPNHLNDDQIPHHVATLYDMPRTQQTDAFKRDFALIKHRNVLDPHRHYKKDSSGIPEYSQMGTIIEGNTEFFNSRINKKDRKNTILDEVMADGSSKSRFKRKYEEIQATKKSGKKDFYKKIKAQRTKAK